MSAAPKSTLTPQEYLARERKAEFRSEYIRGEAFPRARANYFHTLIKDNIASEAGNQLENGPCRALTSDLRVKVEEGVLYTYPDLVVVCDEPKFEDEKFDTLLNPRVIVEVLSESTEKYDRGAKFRQYRTIPSFAEYVLVSQDQALAERYVRQQDDSWLLTVFTGTDAVLAFQSIPVEIPLTEVYAGVKFQSGQSA